MTRRRIANLCIRKILGRMIITTVGLDLSVLLLLNRIIFFLFFLVCIVLS